jgi:hypothetical protein
MLHTHVNRHVSYRAVMPTFHHWHMNGHKYGLSYVSNYDACRFANRLTRAVELLCRQSSQSGGCTYFG